MSALSEVFKQPEPPHSEMGRMSFPRQVIKGRVYLVTRRCTQREFLLRPDEETNQAFLYCLAFAAQRSGVDVVAFIANSNHYHAVVVDARGEIPKFLEDFHKLLAKHQNVLRRRRENFWSSEQTSLVELVDEEDILAKTVYTLANPVKDQLVERAGHWPGSTSLTATLTGKLLYAKRPLHFFRSQGDTPASLTLRCVLPPGLSLKRSEFGAAVRAGIRVAEAAAADERRRTGRQVLGRDAILRQSPTDRPAPKSAEPGIVPRVAARDKGARMEAIVRLKEFRRAYAESRSSWLKGDEVLFPAGTWWLKRFSAVSCVDCDVGD
jgi:putative transposase